jgi:hypothetical protein
MITIVKTTHYVKFEDLIDAIKTTYSLDKFDCSFYGNEYDHYEFEVKGNMSEIVAVMAEKIIANKKCEPWFLEYLLTKMAADGHIPNNTKYIVRKN